MLIKFIRGMCWNGVDYGPRYPEDTVDVEERQARALLAQGAAIQVVPVELPPVPTLSSASMPGVVESRDPQPSARRGKKS